MGDIKTYNIGNIENAQFVVQSLDYQELIKRIEEKQDYVKYLQETGKTDRALKAAAELEELEQQKEQFRENVFRLYETFTKIEINTERLAQAKSHFDQGEFREADAILNAEDMVRDLDRLIERDRQLDQEKAEIEKNKTQIANEFLIKARLWTTFYDQPNRFEQACEYFDTALRAARIPETIFEYAVFLQEHNCFDQANSLYKEALQTYCALAQENPRTYLPDLAGTLNNLAILQKAQNDYGCAQGNFEEALQIRRELAQKNPRIYLPDVATTLNNLAVLQKAQNDYGCAQGNFEEALQTYRKLAQENPRTYLSDLSCILINLSIFYLQAMPNKEKSIAMATEALEILQAFQQVPSLQRYIQIARQVLEANGAD